MPRPGAARRHAAGLDRGRSRTGLAGACRHGGNRPARRGPPHHRRFAGESHRRVPPPRAPHDARRRGRRRRADPSRRHSRIDGGRPAGDPRAPLADAGAARRGAGGVAHRGRDGAGVDSRSDPRRHDTRARLVTRHRRLRRADDAADRRIHRPPSGSDAAAGGLGRRDRPVAKSFRPQVPPLDRDERRAVRQPPPDPGRAGIAAARPGIDRRSLGTTRLLLAKPFHPRLQRVDRDDAVTLPTWVSGEKKGGGGESLAACRALASRHHAAANIAERAP